MDSNVILDYIRNRNRDSVNLLDAIKRKRIRCYTSYYAMFEAIDKEQEDRWVERLHQRGETFDDIMRHRYPRELKEADLKDVYSEFEEKFLKPFVYPDIIWAMVPPMSAWDRILELIQRYNFSIGDAFQVDAAVNVGANIFITNDSKLVKLIEESRMMAASRTDPIELDAKLETMGIRRIVSP